MEYAADPDPRPGAPLQVAANAVPGAEDWLPRVSGHPAWATSLETEHLMRLELSEEQRLQISKELVDLQIATHHLREQHEAEVFELRREGGPAVSGTPGHPRCPQVLRLESRVLELELQGNGACQGHRVQPAANLGQYQMTPLEVPRKAGSLSLISVDHPSGAQQKLQEELKWILEHDRARQQALETQVAALSQQLQGAREEARTAGQQMAAQATVLSFWKGQLRQAEAENAQLQLQLKKLNEEYAVQLQRYAREAVENASSGTSQEALQAFLEATLQDIRAAHRSREQQLAQAARAYRKRLADVNQRQELLLTTCSMPQDSAGPKQILTDRSHGIPRATFATAINLEPLPVHWATELSHPRENECGRHRTLLLYPEKGSGETSKEDKSQALTLHPGPKSSQKLQDCILGPNPAEAAGFLSGHQAELERERAQLMVRATMAEQQLSELQEYVDQHLGRYKQEILKLRKLVNTGDPQGVEAVPSTRPRRPRTRSH
ncbi:Coiled-coil domain-containing protein 78 [Apodemus speciosus]|uniref:Coiled-coil domain-containing protein 78 n=1 Tax=Apodemus speciosus TaxID=105296 RepID=A0ABQ0FN99_APOSI